MFNLVSFTSIYNRARSRRRPAGLYERCGVETGQRKGKGALGSERYERRGTLPLLGVSPVRACQRLTYERSVTSQFRVAPFSIQIQRGTGEIGADLKETKKKKENERRTAR